MEGDGPRSRTANVLPRGASTDANAAPPPLLSVRGLTRDGVLHDVSFEVRAGEILGFGGLVGAGRSEVARCIVGLERRDAGTVAVAGRALPPARMDLAVAAGLALVPEDRQHEGLVLPMRVSENLSMAVLRRLTRWGLIRPAAERALARRHIEALGIRAASPAVPVETLSGGNQQKVAIAKWLATEPRVLILDEPTRGVDVGAKAEVHRLIRQLAAAGSAILLISSDGPELLALSDRIVVLRGGRVAGELGRAEATEEAVLHLALPDAGEAAARA